MPDTFTISYTHKNFAALEPEKPTTRPGVFDTSVIWSYVGRERLFKRSIENFWKKGEGVHIPGTVCLMLDGLEISGARVGEDFELIFMDTERGGNQLPSAKFTIELVFEEELPASWRQGLVWNSRFVREFSWDNRLTKDFDRGLEIARIIMKDSDYKPCHDDEQTYKEWKKSLELLEIAHPGFSRDDLDGLSQVFNSLVPKLSEYKRSEDEHGRIRRGKIATEIADLKRVRPGFRTAPRAEVTRGAEELGKHIFGVFQYYMNKVLRYFKYERMQYWVDEVPSTAEGYFFISNRVVWNNMHELMLYGSHNIHLHMLTRDFNYMQKVSWPDSLLAIQDARRLDRYSEGFELGGIFSQAYRTLVDNHLEQAVILGVIGLEAALGFILDDQARNPAKPVVKFHPKSKRGKRSRKLSHMIHAARHHFTGQDLGIRPEELQELWDRAEAARRKRNDIVHDKETIPKTLENRSSVVEWLDSLRRLSYHLERWREKTFHQSTEKDARGV